MGKLKRNRIAASLAFAAALAAVGAVTIGSKKANAVSVAQTPVPSSKAMQSSPGQAPNAAAATAARADIEKTLGFVPKFLGDMPDVMLPGLWEEFKNLQMNANTALPKATKELIGLGVAAQIPCHYCIEAHAEFAKLGGATDREIGEAVSMAAITRHWSTFLNGIQTDEGKFRGEVKKAVEHMKKSPAPGAGGAAATGTGTAATGTGPLDGQGALKEASRAYGFTPEFLKRFPEVARAGAWRSMKDLEMGPTALSAKHKSLIELGVASQIPCSYCIMAATEFAKAGGATEAEITEAVAMAALTRGMSTMLNGMQTDETQFNADIARLVKSSQAAASGAGKSAPR